MINFTWTRTYFNVALCCFPVKYQAWYQVEPNKWILSKQTFEEFGNQDVLLR
jgi:hypothetical protein